MHDALEQIAKDILEDEVIKSLPGITCLVEDRGDVVFEATRALGRAGVVVLVSIRSFQRRQNSGQLLTGTLALDVTCAETVPVNRRGTDYVTAQHVAETIAQRFHWRTLGGRFASPLRFMSLTKEYPDPKVVSWSLAFEAEYGLGSG